MRISEVTNNGIITISVEEAIKLLEVQGTYQKGTIEKIINKGESTLLIGANAFYNFIKTKE